MESFPIARLEQEIALLINQKLFAGVNLDFILDCRDEATFETEWLRVSQLLDKAEYSETDQQNIKQIEKAAFLRVYAVTQSKDFTELAPLISDDFGLFARALITGIDDLWINGLFASYKSGVIPQLGALYESVSIKEQLAR